MKISIPTEDDRGLDSRLFDHLGSAPFYTMIDLDGGGTEVVRNRDCGEDSRPLHYIQELKHRRKDAVVCRGVGQRAFAALQHAGIQVLVPAERTVAEVVTAVREDRTDSFAADHARGGGRRRMGFDQGRNGYGRRQRRGYGRGSGRHSERQARMR